jgi:uncharacterized membrane protein
MLYTSTEKLMKTIDLVCEILSLIGLVLIIFLVIITYPELPDRIPKHWNYRGIADQWGNKANFFTLPIITFFIYGVFSIVTTSRSNTFKLKASIGEIKSRQIIRLSRIFKTILVGIFLLTIYGQSMNFLERAPIIEGPGVLVKIIIILAFTGLLLLIGLRNEK